MGGLDADQAARRQNSHSRRDFLEHELCGASRGRRAKTDSLCRGSWARANHRRIGLRIWNFRRLRSGFSRFLVDEAAVAGRRRANRVEEVVGPRELVLDSSLTGGEETALGPRTTQSSARVAVRYRLPQYSASQFPVIPRQIS